MKYILIVVILVIVFSSCEKEDFYNKEESIEVANIDNLSLTEKNDLIEDYALLIASSLGDNELRSIIKEEAIIKFDGDYDILTSKLENRVLLKKNIQVKDILVTTSSMSSLKSGKLTGKDYLEKIRKAFPNLQVSVPVHCEDWDTENYIPLVVFLPYDFDESKTNFVFAYDSIGKKHKLSLEEEPDEPVIVVGISERIDRDGKRIGMESDFNEIITDQAIELNDILKSAPSFPTSLTLSHGVANSIILQWADVQNETGYEVWRMVQPFESQFWPFATTGQNDNGYINQYIATGANVSYKIRAVNNDGASAWSPIMTTTVSARNDGDPLRVLSVDFTLPALNAVESWVNGGPEVRLRVVKGSATGASTIYTSGRVSGPRFFSGATVLMFSDICDWYTTTFGTVLTFDWQEEDLINNYEFTLNASYESIEEGGTIKAGGSVKFNVNRNGSIGNRTVLWWDDPDKVYDINGFTWSFFN
jgi:hypothetical protein